MEKCDHNWAANTGRGGEPKMLNLELTNKTAEAVAKAMWESGPDAMVGWTDTGEELQKEFISMSRAGIKKLEEIHNSKDEGGSV